MPDLLLVNANVLTMDPAMPRATAITANTPAGEGHDETG
jgi:predicted amidohydrolase YtcJ